MKLKKFKPEELYEGQIIYWEDKYKTDIGKTPDIGIIIKKNKKKFYIKWLREKCIYTYDIEYYLDGSEKMFIIEF